MFLRRRGRSEDLQRFHHSTSFPLRFRCKFGSFFSSPFLSSQPICHPIRLRSTPILAPLVAAVELLADLVRTSFYVVFVILAVALALDLIAVASASSQSEFPVGREDQEEGYFLFVLGRVLGAGAKLVQLLLRKTLGADASAEAEGEQKRIEETGWLGSLFSESIFDTTGNSQDSGLSIGGGGMWGRARASEDVRRYLSGTLR